MSNVEQYLFQDGMFDEFARNVATLPAGRDEHVHPVGLDAGSAIRGRCIGPDGRASALYPIQAFVRDFTAGRILTYFDVNTRSR